MSIAQRMTRAAKRAGIECVHRVKVATYNISTRVNVLGTPTDTTVWVTVPEVEIDLSELSTDVKSERVFELSTEQLASPKVGDSIFIGTVTNDVPEHIIVKVEPQYARGVIFSNFIYLAGD